MKFYKLLRHQPRNMHILHLLLLCVFAGLVSQGVVFYPDSQGYIEGHIYRSALYPSIIHVFLFLSSAHGLWLLIIFSASPWLRSDNKNHPHASAYISVAGLFALAVRADHGDTIF